ncbi:Adenylosuccinate lyase [Hortaea werneckii]|nr:Adenylosuccinate lyase [Hortaea werneckii]KAI7211240.1 Adenylosuccinate lyase [Hortaea werneckii]KAI7239082.1 Adenylosuccinate lyase [Hortaea werneckii]KAI7307215.1 Adenylosuccinate lyase [Hortaea werneckii]
MAHSRLPNSTNRMVSTPDVRLATLMDLPQLTPTKSALDAKYDTYQNPLNSRYCSNEMKYIFSPRNRFSTWRELWVFLAESERALGLDISAEAIEQMKNRMQIQDYEFETAATEEKRRRHDVMAHVHTYGLAAPAAAGIIHWGATSCYVTDNADLMFLRDAIDILLPKLASVIQKLSVFALKYRDLPCLGYTHGQAAQLVTVGKRATIWIEDLLDDLHNLEHQRERLLDKFRGVKGTTGTQASFLAIFKGDHQKVRQLDAMVTEKSGFNRASRSTTQTYSRKVDVDIIHALASFGCTAERIGGDIRHLAMFKELEEPFEADQIGSSAMAYKRNPMRSERLCSLGRNLSNISGAAEQTYKSQWLERSLDDSAIRRITLPESFLCADACMILLNNISSGLVINKAIIKQRIDLELPFMATENVIMAMVDKGVSRQETHEQIRVLSHQAGAVVKQEGKPNDLLERIKTNEFFKPIWDQLDVLTDSRTFIGRCPEIVEEVLMEDVRPALEHYEVQIGRLGDKVSELNV